MGSGSGGGQRVIAESMSLGGARLDPVANYRVTVNNYLAQGGDGFTVLKDGTAKTTIVAPHMKMGVDAALAVHAAFDDLKTDPAGNAGDRVACGVVGK